MLRLGMRGMSCMEEAVRCSSAWLLSFDKTSTIPAIDYIDTYYDACCWTKKKSELVLYQQNIQLWLQIMQ